MSALFNILASQQQSDLLAYYPLMSNLNDTKGGTPATFERASRKLVYNAQSNLMQWCEEDEPAFQPDGIWLETSETGQLLDADNIAAAGWVIPPGHPNTERRIVYGSPDPTGAAADIQSFRNTNAGQTAAAIYRDGNFIAGNLNSVYGVFLRPEDASKLFGAWLDHSSVPNYCRYSFNPTTGIGTPVLVTSQFVDTSLSAIQLANGWWWVRMFFKRTSATYGGRFWLRVDAGGAAWSDIWCPYLQPAYDSSPILSSSTPTTRAADQLITPVDSSGDDYCLYAQVQFSQRWDLFTTPKFPIFADAVDSSAQFGCAVFRYTDGQAFLRVYHGTDSYFGTATGYAFDGLADYPLQLILRVRKVSATHSQCRIDFRIGSDPWVEGIWTGNILTAQISYSALRWDSAIGVIQTDGYTSVTQSRHVLGVKKIAGVDHTPAAIEAMTT